LYQGRFKSFVIQKDEHLLTVCRYVERNALSAGAVDRAQDWRWGSLFVRQRGAEDLRGMLSDWPVARRSDWIAHVNEPISRAELLRLETSMKRSRPFGDDRWAARAAARLGLEHTIRPEGRPRSEKTVDRRDATKPDN
jgi:putative transposase